MRSRADRSWQEFSQSLLANATSPSLRIAVLAAHPDDETIGASALLARFPASVIYLTDGAPRDSKLWPPDFRGSREEYALLRRAEAERALARAGVPPERIHWLGATDQEAIFSASDWVRNLIELLARIDVDVLITHPYEGGHPDHDSAALVAHIALTHLNLDQAPLLFEMTSYHARDCHWVSAEFLNANAQQEFCIDLSPAENERKRQMFAAHASQRLVLSAFSTDRERFRRAPDYDFSQPPHQGKLWYECMGWQMTGEHWRVLAAQSIARVQEYACR